MTGSAVRLVIAGGGTGGHLMPALAIADAIRALDLGWEITLVGAERGVEATVLPRRAYPFELLPFEPIYRRQWWKNWRWPALATRIIARTGRMLDRTKPTLVLGTGGYASGPVVWLAARRGIRTAVLEQDAFPGLVTRWLAGRVDRIFLGAPEAARHLSGSGASKVLVTGSPIAAPTPERRDEASRRFGLSPSVQTVLVMGGSQGSLAINQLVEGWLERDGEALGRRLQLLWVTGRGTFDQFSRWHRPPAVHVIDFLDPAADGYAVADLVVARAGMMTIAEICAWGLASILIPLPTAAADHQTKNAAALHEAGAAVAVRQADLNAAGFGRAILRLLDDKPALARLRLSARGRGKPDALSAIVSELRTLGSRR